MGFSNCLVSKDFVLFYVSKSSCSPLVGSSFNCDKAIGFFPRNVSSFPLKRENEIEAAFKSLFIPAESLKLNVSVCSGNFDKKKLSIS